VTRHVNRAVSYLGQKNLLTPRLDDLVLERRQDPVHVDLLDQLVAAINGLRRNLLGSQQGLGSLFSMSPIGIARVSRDGLILAANPALSRMLDYSDEELKRTRIPDLLSSQHHGDDTQMLDRLLAEPRLRIDGISGTSAGAMNAAVLVDGYVRGGP
jgi:PAS domain-containing protein